MPHQSRLKQKHMLLEDQNEESENMDTPNRKLNMYADEFPLSETKKSM